MFRMSLRWCPLSQSCGTKRMMGFDAKCMGNGDNDKPAYGLGLACVSQVSSAQRGFPPNMPLSTLARGSDFAFGCFSLRNHTRDQLARGSGVPGCLQCWPIAVPRSTLVVTAGICHLGCLFWSGAQHRPAVSLGCCPGIMCPLVFAAKPAVI